MAKWPFMEMEGRYQKQMGAKRLSFLFPCWGKIIAKKTENTEIVKKTFSNQIMIIGLVNPWSELISLLHSSKLIEI